jgi:hypothetical protein
MEMQDIIGVNSTSQGKPPEGIRSGLAIQYLIENDDIRFAPLIRRMEKGIVDLGQMILELVKQYYEDEDDRYYKIIGDNKQYQLKQFKKVALKGNYDVVVQNSNANPLSKAYKMDNIMQLIQYQILGVEDRPFIAEQLEVGNLKGVYEDIEIDRTRALKEIDDIMHGLPHDFLEFDDHDQHIKVKEKYIKKTPLTPEQRMPLLAAIQQHKDFIAQQQAAAMPGMQAGQGMNPMTQGGAAPQGALLSGNIGGQA